ncbi:MAG TPA: glutamate--tRNA ligase [Nitrospinaceae bacterium]|jgi:glutamyl-tRNA synthetase|nr:glutamate--tRNA ligase [Nitrospinaceae bacterium]
MSDSIKVRFAPSPTGFLHIGGVRTALFNWLFARHHGGKFVLRIEDTDHERSTEESIAEILESMRWLGLDWDEGPYRQTERQELYSQKVDQLFKEGKAYRCTCTLEELDRKRNEAQKKGLKPKYDGTCRDRIDQPEGVPYVIRFKAPLDGSVVVEDLLRGKVIFDVRELDDLILQRTDGSPTYNFVVVVDDADMGISHVIRGDDHLSNTPRQCLLYDALNFSRPKFVHIPMILGQDKARLSKRHGATSALAYREMGFLPSAMINYLARLGWSHGDQEILSQEEMIQYFSFDSVNTSAAVFDPNKLSWLNEHYIKTTSPEELAQHLKPFLINSGLVEEGHDLTNIAKVIPSLNQRAKTLQEMAEKSAFFFKEEVTFDEKAKAKFLNIEAKPLLKKVIAGLSKLENFSSEEIETLFKKIVEEEGTKLGKLAQPVRVALTGTTVSPGIYDVILLLGKDQTLGRLQNALQVASDS